MIATNTKTIVLGVKMNVVMASKNPARGIGIQKKRKKLLAGTSKQYVVLHALSLQTQVGRIIEQNVEEILWERTSPST